jgi:hypothetical protein
LRLRNKYKKSSKNTLDNLLQFQFKLSANPLLYGISDQSEKKLHIKTQKKINLNNIIKNDSQKMITSSNNNEFDE